MGGATEASYIVSCSHAAEPLFASVFAVATMLVAEIDMAAKDWCMRSGDFRPVRLRGSARNTANGSASKRVTGK